MAAERLRQKLSALGRPDRRISPSPEASSEQNGAPVTVQQLQETGKEVQQTEASRTKDVKTITKDDKKRQKQDTVARQKREKKHLRQGVRDDLKSTPLETWLTFTFTVVVGTILLGGGVALIFFGKQNSVTDFIVVGVCGLLMGICFSIVGSFVVFRPVYYRRVERKRAWREEKRQQQLHSKPEASLQSAVTVAPRTVVYSTYFNQGQQDLLTQQLSDTQRQRRPSQVELYGGEDTEVQPDTYAVTLNPPPPLALPNPRANDSCTPEEGAVQHVNVRETTDDDIIVIARAARHENVVPVAKGDREVSGVSVNDLALEQSSRQDSPIKFRESPTVHVVVTHAGIEEEAKLAVDDVLPDLETGRTNKENGIGINPVVDISRADFNDENGDHSKEVPVAFHYDAGGV